MSFVIEDDHDVPDSEGAHTDASAAAVQPREATHLRGIRHLCLRAPRSPEVLAHGGSGLLGREV